MLKKFLLIGAIIIASNFGILATSEAAETDSESYCGDYDDRNCNGGYCSYGKGRNCR